MMARINSPLSQFVAGGCGKNRLCGKTRLWCLAGFTVTAWHNIHVAMRTLPMTMNPHNIFRPPTRWTLRLQDWLWLWLGVSGDWRLLFYLGLVYLGQIGHATLGCVGNVKSDDSAKRLTLFGTAEFQRSHFLTLKEQCANAILNVNTHNHRQSFLLSAVCKPPINGNADARYIGSIWAFARTGSKQVKGLTVIRFEPV
jgi:hypothetical protein